MTDINLLKKSLSRRGYRPALDETGKPFLTRTSTAPGVSFVSTEQLVEEFAKIGKTIDSETLEITDATIPTPTPVETPVEEKPIEKPLKAPKEPKVKKDKKTDNEIPSPQPPVDPSWTLEELQALNYNELRKLASMWPDVHGNKGKDYILEKMTGKPKKAPEQE